MKVFDWSGYFQFVTNVVYLLGVYVTFRKKLYLESVLTFFISVISALYHLCYSHIGMTVSYCILHKPQYHRFLDTLTASVLNMIFIIYLTPTVRIPCAVRYIKLYHKENDRILCKRYYLENHDYPLCYVILIITGLFMFAFGQFYIGIEDVNFGALPGILTVMSYIVFASIVSLIWTYIHSKSFYKDCIRTWKKRFRFKTLLLSITLLLIAFIFAILMNIWRELLYDYLHSFWHVFTGLGGVFFILSLKSRECQKKIKFIH